MKKSNVVTISILVTVVMIIGLMEGCATKGQTGALGGAGIGALAGQLIGGSTEATLIGAAVGTGVGYIVGNEMDKKKAQEMSAKQKGDLYRHDEVDPLGNTRWQVKDIVPKDRVPEFASKIIEFGPHGWVKTTTTLPDGKVIVSDESYRVVGNTLIVNKPGYLINATYGIQGNEMIVSADDFRAVLIRMQ